MINRIKRPIIVFILLLCVAGSFVAGYGVAVSEQKPYIIQAASTAAPAATLDSADILRLVNDYRISNGLQSLEKSDEVCNLAQERATYIHTNLSDAIAHYRPDIAHDGLDIIRNEYGGTLISDLWLAGPTTDAETTLRWISSKTHREHILYAPYSQACVYTDANIAILMIAQP
jgi:uncharacterized protein YkwD